MEMEIGNFQFVFFVSTALNVVMWNMYTILVLDFGHEKLCRRDTELETLLDENAQVLEWCATPSRQWKIVSWLGMNMCQ